MREREREGECLRVRDSEGMRMREGREETEGVSLCIFGVAGKGE